MSAVEEILGFILARITAKRSIEDRGHSTPCWIWRGSLTRRGYGQFGLQYKNWRVHRLVYELLVGPIPNGMTLDHLCSVKECFNPEHLEPVTAEVNSRRAFERGKHGGAYLAARTHCKNGHPYTTDNTAHFSGTQGRVCRECYRSKNRSRYQPRHAA